MQIRTADCGFRELDNSIGGLADLGLWTLFEFDFAHGAIDKGFHCGICGLSDRRAQDVAVGERAYCPEGLHLKEEDYGS